MHTPHQTTKKDRLDVIDWLVESFPAAFFKQPKYVKPLKLGVFNDIIEFYDRLDTPPFSKKRIRDGLHYYSSSKAYLSCQKAGAARVDLYGNEMDIVTEEQAHYAYMRLQERFAAKQT